jgi:hypothetical protein
MIQIFSRYTEISFLRDKNSKKVKEKILKFMQKIERKTNKKVKAIKTNGGEEFLSTNFSKEFVKLGISHQITLRGSPQTNGILDRMNLTVMNRVHSVLESSQLPTQL